MRLSQFAHALLTDHQRLVAKLKAIKAELQRRKYHRTTEVGAWLRKAVLGYYQYHKQRFNVAASRARDQMWIVHSLSPVTTSSPTISAASSSSTRKIPAALCTLWKKKRNEPSQPSNVRS